MNLYLNQTTNWDKAKPSYLLSTPQLFDQTLNVKGFKNYDQNAFFKPSLNLKISSRSSTLQQSLLTGTSSPIIIRPHSLTITPSTVHGFKTVNKICLMILI
jgi:hypothetical protein